jgi:hypothetical protein
MTDNGQRQRDNSGVLFKNDRKSGDRDPDYRGTATIGNIEYRMSAWLKDGRSGKFLSFAFTLKDAPKSAAAKPGRDFDDQIPF